MDHNYHTPIELKRDCEVTLIPSGEKLKLLLGDRVWVTQALGGRFTVRTSVGHLARIAVHDVDALGLKNEVGKGPQGEAGSFSLEKVFEELQTVFDPEIPVNVVDLGLVYACKAHQVESGGYRVEIKMGMTTPGCGMGDILKEDARAKVQTIAGVTDVDIEIILEPAWEQSRMSEAARLQLGIL